MRKSNHGKKIVNLNGWFWFQRRDVHSAWEQYLGLEHSDNASKRSYAANQVQPILNFYFLKKK